MLKNPYDYINDFIKEKIERDRKTNEFVHTQTDSLISWIIGFSVTGLLLIASNFDKLKLAFKNITQAITICILITIVLGIIFRFVSYLIILFQKRLENYFAGLFSPIEMTPIEVSDDIPNADFDYILRRLKDDFNEMIPFPRSLNSEEKAIELPKLIEHYKAWCDYSKKQFDIAIDHLADINETAYKIKREKTLSALKTEMINPKIGYNLILWNRIRGWLYFMTLISFLISIFILASHLL